MIKSLSAAFALVMSLFVQPDIQASTLDYYSIQTLDMSQDEIELLKQDPHTHLWVEGEHEVLIGMTDQIQSPLALHFPIKKHIIPWKNHQLFLTFGMPKSELINQPLKILLYSGRGALIALDPKQPIQHIASHAHIEPFRENTILSTRVEPKASYLNDYQKRSSKAYIIKEFIERLDQERWMSYVDKLSGFHRYTKSQEGTQATLEWLETTLRSLPGVQVSREAFIFGETTSYNLIAKIKGSKTPKDIYIAGAHYDAISEIPDEFTPGAEDNASGVAALLEMAHLFSSDRPASTIYLIAFGSEELGLYGSRAYVKRIENTPIIDQIKGVLTMDMIGFSADSELDILIETSKSNKNMVDHLRALGHLYTTAPISHTFHYWGSDHVPFIDAEIPAVLLIENDYGDYPAYHKTTDTIDKINPAQAMEVLKLLTAQLVDWAI